MIAWLRRIGQAVAGFVRGYVAPAMRGLFGELRWTPPDWIRAGARQVDRGATAMAAARAQRPLRFWTVTSALLIALIGGYASVRWYLNRPQPEYLTISVINPQPTPLEGEDIKPDPLRIAFSGSAAQLGAVGKMVTAGITVTPAIAGTWRWQTDSLLVLTPKNDWDVGQDYSVSFDRALFPSQVVLQTYTYQFNSPRFGATIDDAQFYDDPTDPKDKKIVATIRFTHPVDKASLEREVSLRMRVDPVKSFDSRDAKPIGFKILYDKTGGKAYIHSGTIAIPAKNGAMQVLIGKGVRSARGGPGTEIALKQEVPIPGIAHYFYIETIEGAEVAGAHDEMERVCTVTASVPMRQTELAQNVTAVLLPKDRPPAGDRKLEKNFQWSDPLEVAPEVRALATPLKLEWIPSAREFNPSQSFKFTADTGRFILVTIHRGLQSFGGYPLSPDFSAIVPARSFPQAVKIVSEGSLLSLSGERKISILTRSVGTIRIEVNRILPGSISHLVSQTNGTFSNPNFPFAGSVNGFGIENISELFTQVRQLPADTSGKAAYTVFDFAPLMASGALPHGLFSIEVRAWDPEKKRPVPGGPSDQRLILLTDLGLLVKDSSDGSHDVFVQSIRSGTPMANVAVEILGRNGLPVLTRKTDADGRASFPSLKDFTLAQLPTVYVAAEQNDDFSFIPYDRADRRLNLSRFDTGGVYLDQDKESLEAYLFSDRGIYRPGDAIHVGIVLKRLDWQAIAAGLPLELAMTDPRGYEIRRQLIKFGPDGFEEFDTSTTEDAPTGSYEFLLYIVRDGKRKALLGSTAVRVEDFQPDRMTIKAELSAPPSAGWIAPGALSASVQLRTLFGTAAANRRVKGSFTLAPAAVYFARYAGYQFVDPYAPKHSYSEELGDLMTDADGKVKFDLKLERFERGVFRLRFVGEGFEPEGGRSVMADADAMVSPAPYLVAYKPDGDLTYIHKNSRRMVNLIAVDPRLTMIARPDLAAELIEIRYDSVLTKQDNGTMAFQSVRREISRRRWPLAIPASGLAFQLPTDAAGSFALLIRNAGGDEINRVSYEVIGNANVSRSLEREAELKIKLDRAEYAPGAEAEVEIQAPYSGAGLITVERDRIYSTKWFKTTTTETVQKIAIPAGLEGNGYVTVTFVRALDSPEIFTSPLSYGSAPFTIDRSRHTDDVKITAPAMVRPGAPLTVGYQTAAPARVVVFSVDEGILQVARYQTPDPLSFFFRKRALEVTTAQILDLILPELHLLNEASATGGDEEKLLARSHNPFKRKGQKPLVFWSGVIDSNGAPSSITIPVPDYFNGTIRVMAVAVAGGTVGVAEHKVIAQGDFVLQPQAPYFATPGDEFDVTSLVANNLPATAAGASSIKVELTATPHLTVIGSPAQTIAIAPGRDATVSFRVRANAVPGDATMVLKASGSGRSASYTFDMSVRPASPYVTTLTSGYVKANLLRSVKATLTPTRKMYSEERSVEVAASALPLGLASGLVQYLTRYPYGCTEQVVSAALPGVVLGTRPEVGLSTEVVNASLARAIATLQGRQNAEGAFGLWSAGPDVSNFVNAYATNFLLEMRDHGLEVPPALLERALKSLRTMVATPATSMPELRAQSYALYLLARNGVVVTGQLEAVREALDTNFPKAWTNDSTALYMAAAYQLLKMDRQANELIKHAPTDNPVAADYDNYFDDLAYRATYIYIVAKHFPERARKIGGDQILELADRITRGNNNTYSSAMAIIALDAYDKAAGAGAAGPVTFTEALADGSTRPLATIGTDITHAEVPPEAKSVNLAGDTPFALFYQLTESGFDLAPPTTEIRDDIEVFRDFRNERGEVITSATLDSKVDVYMSVRALTRNITNVAVVDLLPGGFEVDLQPGGIGSRQSLRPGPDTWQPDYIDVREDRVVFYGTVTTDARKFVYRLKPTNRGKFAVPPLYAEGMYDRSVRARSLGGNFEVIEAPAVGKR